MGLFYVGDLKKVAVGSYDEIDRRIEEGTANRTVASTQMNATSSRAHTVVTIEFTQKKMVDGNEMAKQSGKWLQTDCDSSLKTLNENGRPLAKSVV